MEFLVTWLYDEADAGAISYSEGKAYEVINPVEEVTTDMLRNMRNDGIITNYQYNKWIKGK